MKKLNMNLVHKFEIIKFEKKGYAKHFKIQSGFRNFHQK